MSSVKCSLEQAVKAQMGVEVGSTLSLTSVLDGVGRQRHPPAALPPGKPGTDCTGGSVGPKAGLDGCRKSRLDRDSIPGPSGS
jgi:hypothetical protein